MMEETIVSLLSPSGSLVSFGESQVSMYVAAGFKPFNEAQTEPVEQPEPSELDEPGEAQPEPSELDEPVEQGKPIKKVK